MGQRKGSMMSALYRASNILGRKGKGDLDDGGMQYTATHCNILQHTAAYYNTLQRSATLCNTLQHTASPCNAHDSD